jgi:hypothetical protein
MIVSHPENDPTRVGGLIDCGNAVGGGVDAAVRSLRLHPNRGGFVRHMPFDKSV